uniref:Reverse transcriptase domain-containing protein n=2 Tax=Strongyloides stercoralis TaxID=6248 RepID=A0AAF5DMQ7_STRER
MSRWTEKEIKILEEISKENKEKRNLDDYNVIKNTYFPSRTVAAIKKKLLEVSGKIKESKNIDSRKATVWTNEELEKLKKLYEETPKEKTKTKRVEMILHHFPNRSIKAIQTVLRQKFSELYEGYSTSPKKHEIKVIKETKIKLEENIKSLKNVNTNEIEIKNNGKKETNKVIETTNNDIDDKVENENKKDSTEKQFIKNDCPVKKEFYKFLTRIQSQQNVGKLAKFSIRRDHPLLEKISTILQEYIDHCEIKIKKISKRHKNIKQGIVAATYTLRKKLLGQTGLNKQKPKYKFIEGKINRIENDIKRCKEIQSGAKQNNKNKKVISIIKKLKMTPSQFISSCQERIEILKENLNKQKEQFDANKVRYRFKNNPSLKCLGMKPRNIENLNFDEAEEFYRKLYSNQPHPEKSPNFDEWLEFVQNESLTSDDSDVEEKDINRFIEEHLTEASLWKSPGKDLVTNFMWKYIPPAKRYLKKWINQILQSTYKLTENDVEGKCILIHKQGETNDVQNFRPICLLNTDYKCFTKILVKVTLDRISENLIPKEQLCRENTWGTVHGLLQDKSYLGIAKYRRQGIYSTWYDFSKAYDSLNHYQLQRLLEKLPLPKVMKSTAISLLKLWNMELVRNDEKKPRKIRIRRGIMQGDSSSPLWFILASGSIIYQMKNNQDLRKVTKNKGRIIGYMDDLKWFSPNQEGMKLGSKILKESALELTLHLNEKKCGYYNESDVTDENEKQFFIPKIRKAYKYLGLMQKDKDVEENYEILEEKLKERTRKILSSHLTTHQKQMIYNGSVVTSAVYVLGNLSPKESIESTLKKANNLDIQLRKIAVSEKVKVRQMSNSRYHLPERFFGMNFRSIKTETCIQFIRRFCYLMSSPDLEEARKNFEAMDKGGCRTPISDFRYVAKKYKLSTPKNFTNGYREVTKELIEAVKKIELKEKLNDWSKAMTYPKLVLKYEKEISYPGIRSLKLSSDKLAFLSAASEEQIFLKAKNFSTTGKGIENCRFGCNKPETNTHVTSNCKQHQYAGRHDIITWNVLKKIMEKYDIKEKLEFGSAVVDIEKENIKITAGRKILTEKKIYYNTPDVVLYVKEKEKVKKIIVLEVSVPSLTKYCWQQQWKRIKYCHNSVNKLEEFNANKEKEPEEIKNIKLEMIPRNINLINILKTNYKIDNVQFYSIVVGTYGELVFNEETLKTKQMFLTELKFSKTEYNKLIRDISYSAMASTARILAKHLAHQNDII